MPDPRRSTRLEDMSELRTLDDHNRPARFWAEYLAPGSPALKSYSAACRRHGKDAIRVVNSDGETLFYTHDLEPKE